MRIYLATALLALSCAQPKSAPNQDTKKDNLPTSLKEVPPQDIKKDTPVTQAASTQASKDGAALTAPVASAPIITTTPGPLELTTKIPALEHGMMDHAYIYGWSSDGSEFGYCSQGAMSVSCDFIKPDGTHEGFGFDDDGSTPKKKKELEKRLKDKGYAVPAASWVYASDLVISWTASGSDEIRPLVLKVGAVMRGDKDVDYSISLPFTAEYLGTVHPETIALSPDGKFLAVLAHAYGGEYSDTFAVDIKPVGFFASQAYNKAGLGHHKAKDYPAAIAFFQQSIDADATYSWAYYNLACAKTLAKAPEPEIEAALKKALELGGDKMKKQAKTNKDFEAVRAAPWFVLLVG